jgi:hypothetical protein
MQNPIIQNQRRKRINRFVKYYYYSFVFAFVLSTIAYKTGTMGSGLRPSYYKPTPNTWQYVSDQWPDIVVFSLVAGLLLTLPIPPSNDE